MLATAALLWPLCAGAGEAARRPVAQLHITILSDTVAGGPRKGLAEWGYSALITTDTGTLLFDTGGQPGLVADNAKALGVDLSKVRDVVLSHYHPDHVGGLVALRQTAERADPSAISVAHVATGMFLARRTKPDGPDLNPMARIRPEYEAEQGRFVVNSAPVELTPGVWLTGPVPRVREGLPVRGLQIWHGGQARPETYPEEQAVVIDTVRGLVVLSPCSHAGILNVLDYVRKTFGRRPILAVIGGLHLAERPDAEVHRVGNQFGRLGVRYALLGHCTGLAAVEMIRRDMHADRRHAAASTVGASFDLSTGIATGEIAG